MNLTSLLQALQLARAVLGFLLAVNAGRGLARRMHDAELARRYGRSLPPGLGIVFYIYFILAFLVNLSVLAFTQALGLAGKALLGAATGHVFTVIASLAETVAGLVLGYVVFSRRYRGVEKPLTREGRIALRGVELGREAPRRLEEAAVLLEDMLDGFLGEVKKRLPGPPIEDTEDERGGG